MSGMFERLFSTCGRVFVLCAMLMFSLVAASPSYCAEVIIIGETRLKPVMDVVTAVQDALRYETVVRSPAEVRDDGLHALVIKENAKVVVALGKGAVQLSLTLPETVPVVYGLVVEPFETDRRNITGVYMATPVSEYMELLNRYFPDIRKVGMVHEPGSGQLVGSDFAPSKVEVRSARNSYEFVERITGFKNDIDALLLLPEKNLITSSALNEVYLYSFSEKVPVIGISEKYVKVGSFFSLVFDTGHIGRQLGTLVERVVARGSAANIPVAAPEKYNLYINSKTAKKMNLDVPAELYDKAKKVYQ